jgi:hypothetical protein
VGKLGIVLRLVAIVLLLLLSTACAEPLWPPRSFSAYYGKIEADTPRSLADFDLLIVHPGRHMQNLDPDKVALLKAIGKPKTVVGYISIGEDDVSPGGPPLLEQDHSGPSFVGKDLRQALASNDYPAYFMDQRRVLLDADGFLSRGPNGKSLEEKGQDGHPDENGVWGSYYARADDPVWRARVFARLEELDRLGLDGFFLDTVDTASPWGDYGWIRARYPGKRIVANRGLFYLGGSDRYARAIDAVLFESLLTHYQEETASAEVSPWARWHVQALENDVIPTQKRTGLTLLVLDYLAPDHPDAPLLVQSARTLLAGAPQSCLSFSHPLLRIPGWPAESLLSGAHPAQWPAVSGLHLREEEVGAFTLTVDFDGPVPADAWPDLRVTTRTDVAPRLAAELPLTPVLSYRVDGQQAVVRGHGLDKDTLYQVFFRLISRAPAPQSPFAWSSFKTRPSELPAQVSDLSSESVSGGLQLSFACREPAARFRVYRQAESGQRELLLETDSSPVLLPQTEIDQALRLVVSALDPQGREGYPSSPHLAVRRNVTPPPAPAAVTIEGDARQTLFSWQPVVGAKSYRLYVIPEGQQFRLPLVVEEPSAQVRGARPGVYRVFATSVDKDGNQSQPGRVVRWRAE